MLWLLSASSSEILIPAKPLREPSVASSDTAKPGMPSTLPTVTKTPCAKSPSSSANARSRAILINCPYPKKRSMPEPSSRRPPLPRANATFTAVGISFPLPLRPASGQSKSLARSAKRLRSPFSRCTWAKISCPCILSKR